MGEKFLSDSFNDDNAENIVTGQGIVTCSAVCVLLVWQGGVLNKLI